MECEVSADGGAISVKPPFGTIGEYDPIEEAFSRGVFGMVKVVLNLLAGEPAGRFVGGKLVEWMAVFLGFKRGGAETEKGVRIRFRRGGEIAVRSEKAVVGALASGEIRH
ncbi:MAG: hypothetical protein ABSD57_06215 [Verrucomicrobiota bacterium]